MEGKKASLVYKCRMCEKRFEGYTTFSSRIIGILMDLTLMGTKPLGIPVNIHIVHNCDANRKGVADLIGLEGDF